MKLKKGRHKARIASIAIALMMIGSSMIAYATGESIYVETKPELEISVDESAVADETEATPGETEIDNYKPDGDEGFEPEEEEAVADSEDEVFTSEVEEVAAIVAEVESYDETAAGGNTWVFTFDANFELSITRNGVSIEIGADLGGAGNPDDILNMSFESLTHVEIQLPWFDAENGDVLTVNVPTAPGHFGDEWQVETMTGFIHGLDQPFIDIFITAPRVPIFIDVAPDASLTITTPWQERLERLDPYFLEAIENSHQDSWDGTIWVEGVNTSTSPSTNDLVITLPSSDWNVFTPGEGSYQGHVRIAPPIYVIVDEDGNITVEIPGLGELPEDITIDNDSEDESSVLFPPGLPQLVDNGDGEWRYGGSDRIVVQGVPAGGYEREEIEAEYECCPPAVQITIPRQEEEPITCDCDEELACDCTANGDECDCEEIPVTCDCDEELACDCIADGDECDCADDTYGGADIGGGAGGNDDDDDAGTGAGGNAGGDDDTDGDNDDDGAESDDDGETNNNVSSRRSPKTGDSMNGMPLIILALLASLIAGVIIFKNNRKKAAGKN